MLVAAWVLAAKMPVNMAQQSAVPPDQRGIVSEHFAVYRSPFIAAPGLGWLCYTFVFLALLTLLPLHVSGDASIWLIGSIPLMAMGASMTIGVALLRFLPAIHVVVAGFALLALAILGLLLQPGAVGAYVLLAVAFGLVQGASFAAVPQLNKTARDQARANGAMAQMGNMGNTLGTPALALISGQTGHAGMMLAALLVTLAGIALHLGLARLRRQKAPR